MNIFLGRGQNMAQIEPKSQQEVQKISAGLSKLLLQNVKMGDLLTGEIIDSLQKQVRLLLPDGTLIEATLEKSLDFYIGQEVTLEVKEIIGKHVHMEMVLESKASAQETSPEIVNILKQLNLPITDDSEQAVKFLMQKMLPLTRDNIKQLEFGLKTSQLPVDTILSMLENEIPVTPSTLTQIQAYENGEIKLQGQLEVMIDNILESDDGQVLEEVRQVLMAIKTSRGEPTNQIKESKTEPIIRDENEMAPAKFSPGLEKDLLPLKKEILQVYKELFFIDPSGLKDKSETKLEKIKVLYKDIYKLADHLEKLESLEEPGLGKEKPQLFADIKSNIEFLTIANKYDTIIHIPLIIQDQYKHGELYIFNKKKTDKKSYHEASMLISLETNFLGRVEVYIKKYNDQISAQFKTDDEEIEHIIKKQIQGLKNSLKDKGYHLISVTYIPSQEPFALEEKSKKDVKAGRYRFDTKA